MIMNRIPMHVGVLILLSVIVLLLPKSSKADWEDLFEIARRQSEALTEWKTAAKDTASLSNKLSQIQSAYRFVAKADNLRIGEFETEADFEKRVMSQREKDAVEKRSMENERHRIESIVIEEIHKAERRQRNAEAQWRNVIDTKWVITDMIQAEDLPYFSRDDLSFTNITLRTIPATFEERKIKFSCTNNVPSFTLSFESISDAYKFKQNLTSGKWTFWISCICRVSAPHEGVVRGEWYEYREKTTTDKVLETGIAIAAIIVAAKVNQSLGGNNSDYGNYSSSPYHYDKMKTIRHKAITGVVYDVEILGGQCILEGQDAEDCKGLKLRVSALHENWKLKIRSTNR